MTDEVKRLREWLTTMVNEGPADDMDPKAWWADAALKGWTVEDWKANIIPEGPSGNAIQKETKAGLKYQTRKALVYKRTIFVFGSNLAGRHGKGAALFARKYYSAEYGVGEGLTGDSYALPTKDHDLKVRPLRSIEHSVTILHEVIQRNQDLLFILTPIGCGYAGYSRGQIAGLFKKYKWPKNLVLSFSWIGD